jgi:hypothetical protein
MENVGHSCRIHPDFAHISGNVRSIAALGKIWGPDHVEAILADLNVSVGGRARAKSREFHAGGHDMYEKAGTYAQNAKLAESRCY